MLASDSPMIALELCYQASHNTIELDGSVSLDTGFRASQGRFVFTEIAKLHERMLAKVQPEIEQRQSLLDLTKVGIDLTTPADKERLAAINEIINQRRSVAAAIDKAYLSLLHLHADDLAFVGVITQALNSELALQTANAVDNGAVLTPSIIKSLDKTEHWYASTLFAVAFVPGAEESGVRKLALGALEQIARDRLTPKFDEKLQEKIKERSFFTTDQFWTAVLSGIIDGKSGKTGSVLEILPEPNPLVVPRGYKEMYDAKGTGIHMVARRVEKIRLGDPLPEEEGYLKFETELRSLAALMSERS